MAFTPDGRILATERTGRVRVIQNGALHAEPWATLAVFAVDTPWMPESGLLGIALAPDYADSRHVYLYGTFRKPSGRAGDLWRRLLAIVSPARASRFENRVYRFTDRGERGADSLLVIGGLPANALHAGGALAFGPDGMLYLTTGDTQHPASAPRVATLAGKVLRFRPDGGIPADNPVAGSPVFARGLRNSQGLAWEPVTGTLFAIEHGPTGMEPEGGRSGHDELNVIEPSAHYGWPDAIGRDTAGGSRPPVRVWSAAIAPAGLTLYQGSERLWRGNLFVTGLTGVQLRRLVVEQVSAPSRWRVIYDEPLLTGRYGRLRAVAAAPDGSLYVGTSNRDGRGSPGPADDLLLRLVPLSCDQPGRAIRTC